jgi:hypothetical protein
MDAALPPLTPRNFSVAVEDGVLHVQLLDVGLQARRSSACTARKSGARGRPPRHVALLALLTAQTPWHG